MIYFIKSYILNDTVHITGPFCVIFKTFCLIVINKFILTELIFLRFRNKSYFAFQKLMHIPASRQPGASYAQRPPWHTKKGFRYVRSSGDETLLGHLWPTDYYPAKWIHLNFQPLEIVSRYRDHNFKWMKNTDISLIWYQLFSNIDV